MAWLRIVALAIVGMLAAVVVLTAWPYVVMSLQAAVDPLSPPPTFGHTEFVQEYEGARKLLGFEPVLPYATIHPPTAFLFSLPFGLLPFPIAIYAWMAAMLACMLIVARVYGLPWPILPACAALIYLWPPSVWSLPQITPVWLLGLALAWRCRSRPAVAGALIAAASLPKYLAAVSLGAFVPRKPRHRVRALAGFAAVWFAALAVLIALRAEILPAYVTTNVTKSLLVIARPDNGALLPFAWRFGGPGGLALALVMMSLVLHAALSSEGAPAWACWTWLGVAALPIAWVYSLLPLLPWLLHAAQSRRLSSSVPAILGLLAPYLSPIPSFPPFPAGVVLCMLCSGFACIGMQREAATAAPPSAHCDSSIQRVQFRDRAGCAGIAVHLQNLLLEAIGRIKRHS